MINKKVLFTTIGILIPIVIGIVIVAYKIRDGKKIATNVFAAMDKFQGGAYMELRGVGVGDYGYFYYWTGEFATNKVKAHTINLLPDYVVKFDHDRTGEFKFGDWVYSKPINGWVIVERAWVSKDVLDRALEIWKVPSPIPPVLEKDSLIKDRYHEIENGWNMHEIWVVPTGWIEKLYPYGFTRDAETGGIVIKKFG